MIYRHEQQEKRAKWTGPRPGFPKLDKDLWPKFVVYLGSRKLDHILARANGWYPASYKGERIVIPCSNSVGIPYFQARDMRGTAKLRYASPPASREDSLVLMWPEKRARGTVIVEGPTDALAAAEQGFLGVGLMGNDPSHAVIEYLVESVRSFQPAYVVPDLDHLEMCATIVGALSLRGIKSKVIISGKKDLAAMTPKQREELLDV